MNAFFDIDTQIDFLFPAGALYAPGAERLLPTIAKLNRYAVDYAITLISTVCAHPENAEEFRVWPPHCVLGTVGQSKPAATLVGEKQILFPKNQLDPFSNPDFIPLLDSLGIEECTVYGVLTEYCVKHAAMGLLKTGRKVRLLTDAIHHLDEAAASEMLAGFTASGGTCETTRAVLS